MTVTEIFKTSFETVKSHKKQTLILCVLFAVIRIITDLFSEFHILIVSTISSFVIALVLLPFIYILKESKIDRKQLLTAILSYTLISVVVTGFVFVSSSLTAIIENALVKTISGFQIYRFTSLVIRLILLIIVNVSDYFVILAVSEAIVPLKSVKLLFDNLKSGFWGKIFKIEIISFIINLPISIPTTIIEYTTYANVTDTIQFKIISIPFHIYTIVCMYTYWNLLKQKEEKDNIL